MREEKFEDSSYRCSVEVSHVQKPDIIPTTYCFVLQRGRQFKLNIKLVIRALFLKFVPPKCQETAFVMLAHLLRPIRRFFCNIDSTRSFTSKLQKV